MRGPNAAIRMGIERPSGISTASFARWYEPSKVTVSPRTSGAVVRAVEGDGLAADERRDDAKRLLEPLEAVVEGIAEGAVLLEVPSGAKPEGDAATAHRIRRGRHLREQPRRPVGGAHDQLSDLDSARSRGYGRNDRPSLVDRHARRLVRRAREEVVVRLDRVQSDRFGTLGDRSGVRAVASSLGA